jgi:hypothetical protein
LEDAKHLPTAFISDNMEMPPGRDKAANELGHWGDWILFHQAKKPMGGKGPDPDGRETESHAGEDIHPGQEDLTGAHQGKCLQAE